DWLKWMPHALSPDEVDGTAPRRLIATTPDELHELIDDELSRRAGEASKALRLGTVDPSTFGPAFVIVIDASGGERLDPFAGLPRGIAAAQLGMHTITLVPEVTAEGEKVDVRVTVDADAVHSGGVAEVAVTDLRAEPDDADEAHAARQRTAGADHGIP